MFTIYALAEPETMVIRYVGRTNDPVKRLWSHVYRASRSPRNHSQNWIGSLLNRGLKPAWVVCDTCEDESTANELERAWIRLFRAAEVPLTNHTDGGEGASGRNCTQETRQKIGDGSRGTHHSEETRKKQSESHRGKRLSDQHRKNLGDAHRGKPRSEAQLAYDNLHRGKPTSEETRKKIGDAHRGKPERLSQSESHRKKTGDAQRGRPRREETRKKIGEAHRGKIISVEHRRQISEARRGRPWTVAQRKAYEDKWGNVLDADKEVLK